MWRSVFDLASDVRSGELSARELVSESLRRIDELQPTINAFTHVAHEAALAAADEISPGDPRPFAGVPIAIKDNRAVSGMPITMCSDLFADITPRHDTGVVRRLREAGFVIVGKTALPEMGILPTTESRRFGPTSNPWDLGRTPGGSSGGSAAAVAAGMVPIAHGNDGGGSTRIPAACCGLVGLKSSRGRVSLGPELGQSFFTIDGVLTRTVAETAALTDILTGYELGDATWAPAPSQPLAESAAEEPSRLRIALTLTPPLDGAPVDPVCAQAARDAAALLESLGHDVEEITAPWAGLDLLPDLVRVFGPMVCMTVMIGGRLAGREPTEGDVEPLTWGMWQNALQEDSIAFLSAQGHLETASRQIITALSGWDAVLTPSLAARPVRTGEIHGRGPDPWEHFGRSGPFTPFTAIANVSGLPAISLPLYHGDDGLPTGVQLIGRPLGEDTLLALGTQLERALPWSGRRAPDPLAAAPVR